MAIYKRVSVLRALQDSVHTRRIEEAQGPNRLSEPLAVCVNSLAVSLIIAIEQMAHSSMRNMLSALGSGQPQEWLVAILL